MMKATSFGSGLPKLLRGVLGIWLLVVPRGVCEDAFADEVLKTGDLSANAGEGYWSLYLEEDRAILDEVSWMAILEGGQGLVSKDASSSRLDRVLCATPLGTLQGLEWSCAFSSPKARLVLQLAADPDRGILLAKETFFLSRDCDESVQVQRLLPLTAGTGRERQGNAPFLPGISPKRCRLLQTGKYSYFDFMTEVRDASCLATSNGQIAVWCPEERLCFSAGCLTQGPAAVSFLCQGSSSRFLHFVADCRYCPSKTVRPGESLRSEWICIGAQRGDPLDPLLRYGQALGDAAGRPQVRDPGNVADGWNSWGYYRQDIDEKLILDELDAACRTLKPFGLSTFQIDDGWEREIGDWFADPVRFPRGMAWMAEQIRERGLTPGLWISPFWASPNSRLAEEHPSWFLSPASLPRELISDKLLLDATLPEVQSWLRGLFHRIAKEWGYGWIKVDFAYYEALARGHAAANVTGIEAYRQGIRVIRDAIGPDTHLLGVGLAGANVGLVDSLRLNLDVMPRWRNLGGEQNWGITETAGMLAHRFFYHGNAWINHGDMLYFRSPLTEKEQVCWATAVALSGANLELGDPFTRLTEEQVNVVSKLLPVHGRAARPLDLFERDLPAIWHLPLRRSWGSWHVLGFFHWGDEGILSHELDLSTLGLEPGAVCLGYDFWQGLELGPFTDSFHIEVPPRSVRLICIHEALDRPQLISTNRHFTQGAVGVQSLEWKEGAGRLQGRARPVRGVPLLLFVHAPRPFVPVSHSQNLQYSQRDDWMTLSLEGASGRQEAWWVDFRREDDRP